ASAIVSSTTSAGPPPARTSTDSRTSRALRSPKVSELAALMNLSEEEVVEAQIAAKGYTSASLDAPLSSSDEDKEAALSEVIGIEDPALELVEDFRALAPLLADLRERERLIIHLRFVEERTQAEIGKQLGISQMHVSRLLSRLLTRLRSGMFSIT
ncbi:sigma-70 family RNA polymerase sigma factor, partial [Streptomyces sp. NPDC049099]|uniref:sigma-70 family RNA polymerase sigma factor n=1 Tax=Streptomyces sp. NPDC049099 TaxID=3155768 RepID=UPI00343C35CE